MICFYGHILLLRKQYKGNSMPVNLLAPLTPIHDNDPKVFWVFHLIQMLPSHMKKARQLVCETASELEVLGLFTAASYSVVKSSTAQVTG